MTTPEDVLSFWFANEPVDTDPDALARRMKFWFMGGATTDAAVRETLGPLLERAARGELDAWRDTPKTRLALLIVLDQAPRNVHRGRAEAFAHDAVACALADDGIERGLDASLGITERIFFNMPRGHSEELAMQRRAYAYMQTHVYPGAPPIFEKTFDGIAKKHVEVLERFGRFPQRNAALGRTSTDEETAYLDELRRTGRHF